MKIPDPRGQATEHVFAADWHAGADTPFRWPIRETARVEIDREREQ